MDGGETYYMWLKLGLEVGLTAVALYMAKSYISELLGQMGPNEKEVETSAKKRLANTLSRKDIEGMHVRTPHTPIFTVYSSLVH